MYNIGFTYGYFLDTDNMTHLKLVCTSSTKAKTTKDVANKSQFKFLIVIDHNINILRENKG